ncbi:MAG: PQQ-binding-like beta-propeller repeat protein, partial [Planctomycetaceae bacterium]|nr:PQQ-binding-like beta-propeller repeat protein [Planctomycetaceae bacterium]
MSRLVSGGMIVCLTLSANGFAWGAGLEWPQWRGPNRDAVSTETGLLKEWSEGGPRLVWKTNGVGDGFSGLAISGGKIFTLGRKDKKDFLEAFALDGGKSLWSTRFAEGGDNPTGSPTVDEGLVYAISNGGQLVCCDADSGKIVWEKNFE